MDETDPKGVREYGHFKTHHTYCPVAFMLGVFPFTLPMEYGFQLLIFFMTTGLDFNAGGGGGGGRGAGAGDGDGDSPPSLLGLSFLN